MPTPLDQQIQHFEARLAELRERQRAYLEDPWLALLDQVALMRYKKDVSHEELIRTIRDYNPEAPAGDGTSTPA